MEEVGGSNEERKGFEKSVVKALKGRSKQELASEDVEAQAESGKMESEVQVVK